MGTLSIKRFTGSILSDEEMLSLWRQVSVDIAETGQSYRSPGGMEVSLADIDKVHAQIRYWEKRVLAKRGYSGHNIADIEDRETENRETL